MILYKSNLGSLNDPEIICLDEGLTYPLSLYAAVWPFGALIPLIPLIINGLTIIVKYES